MTFYAFIFSLLLAAAFKDDTAQITNSEFWSDLSWHPFVVILKSNFTILAALNVVIGAFLVVRERSPVFMKITYLLVLAIMYVVATSRAVFADVDHAAKLSVTIAILVWVWIVIGKSRVLYGTEVSVSLAEKSISAFAIFFVILNLINYASGYGYVPGNPRFFGTSGHPNFIGVQLALCNLLILFRFGRTNGRLTRILTSIAFLFGIYLMIITGSRTAIVMFIGGLVVLYGIGGRGRMKLFILPLFLILGLAYSFVGATSPDSLDMYGRGEDTTDTRTEAWASMLTDISESPWMGKGVPSGKSENSYLKASKEYGVLYGIILIALVVSRILTLYRFTKTYNGIIYYQGWLTVISALAIGGCFEGFLDDSFSFPLMVFCLVLSVPVVKRRAVRP